MGQPVNFSHFGPCMNKKKTQAQTLNFPAMTSDWSYDWDYGSYKTSFLIGKISS